MKVPLSEQLRPKKLQDLVGQNQWVQENGFLKQLIEKGKAMSILLWGPPGCGKTTLAKIYGESLSVPFHQLSAVSSSIQQIRDILQQAEKAPLFNPYVVIFLDEIHRFNKSQQDLFLPYLENGKLILIGATTENPSFALNNALLSRMRVFTFSALNATDLSLILERFEKLNQPLSLTLDARNYLIGAAQGDGRYLLNMVENLELTRHETPLSVEELKKILQKRAPLFDKQGEGHYNLISALHKSIRGSDPDATLYWLNRILNGGEEPLYIARRLIRIASEDIGLADPQALNICLNAHQCYQILGSPEGELAIAEAAIYLALCPKSNSSYTAFKKSLSLAESTGQISPPLHILNAPTQMMKNLNYGKDYQYDHDCQDQFSGQNYFPESFTTRPSFYQPQEIGFEREMKKRLDYFTRLRAEKNQK